MQPSYRITEKMLNQVQRISELTTQLALERRELHLRKENRVRSIQSSLAIENNSLSLEQVTAVIDGKRVLGPPKDIHEVENAYEAYERAFRLDPYRLEDFLEAHRLLTKDLVKHAGQFRTGDVGVYDSTGHVVHVGARPQFVPALVEDLFAWAKASSVSDFVKSCVVHFELEIIHPFEDGNGRMGRLWQSLILSQSNPIFEWLPVESVIYHHQQGYYDALTLSNQANDSTVFIEFMLDAILETLQEYQTAQPTSSVTLKPKEEAVWQKIRTYLLEHGVITTSLAQDLIGLSEASTRRYLSLFVQKDLLTLEGSTRDRHYKLPTPH
ncbi:Fic family protein [Streptococcus tangpeifui]|uniref:Fic family protein n=1 Tax=Streptococcus tangpeifui TaxID=2709400 RepID=UPI0013EBA26D|nr:Fic family protein [Streptococcus sp. ZJ1593]